MAQVSTNLTVSELLQVQEIQLNHAKAAIAMLTAAHELYKRGSQRANRLMYHIGGLLAREHLAAEDLDSAQKLLEAVAGKPSCSPRISRACA